MGLTTDYAGNSVSNPPSIGAMQYGTVTGSGGGSADPASGSADPASGRGGGGCFIATAAFGSYLDPHVAVLRSFRDHCLLTNRLGKAFVSWYYATSPPYADSIRHNGPVKAVVRIALFPLIGFAYLCLLVGFIPASFGALCLVLAVGTWWIRGKALKDGIS